MKTRFDFTDIWVTADGTAAPLKEMSTSHLLNTVKMLVQKPSRTLSILISDIESNAFSGMVWTADINGENQKKSLENVTSLSEAGLVEYVQKTPLFNAMLSELAERGVNVGNVMDLFEHSEAFKA